MPCEKELSDRTAAIARNDVDSLDRKLIYHFDEHFDLSIRTHITAVCNFGESHPQEVGSDTSFIGTETFNGAAPLKTAEWKSVKKKRRVATSEVRIGNPAKSRSHVPSGRIECLGFRRVLGCRCQQG